MSLFFRTEENVYHIEQIPLPEVSPTAPEVTHHVLVVDRSGSMWGDMDGLKSAVEQALAVESTTSNVDTTLVSFSSHRDVTLHWANIPVRDVVDLKGPYLKILRGIRATCLTGISQALDLALQQVKPGQTTGITLFTDGYANDPSAYEENKRIRAFVGRVQSTYPNVFVNCIGFRDWCDWSLMGEVANATSGTCTKAQNFNDVLRAMKDTQALLAGSLSPAVQLEPQKDSYVVAVNTTTGQVNASPKGEGLTLRGIRAEDEVLAYRITLGDAISKAEHALSKEDMWLAGALAKAFLSLGDIRKAKGILFSSGNKTLWDEHQSALTSSTLAALGVDLTAWVVEGNNDAYEMGRNERPPYSLFTLAEVINRLPYGSLGLNLDVLFRGYQRRTVKSLAGTRQEDGSIAPNRAELVPRPGSKVLVKSIDFNTGDASVQVSTSREVWVRRLSDGAILEEVEGVSLAPLREYRSYTLLASGERNVEYLPLEVLTQEAISALAPFLPPAEVRDFVPGKTVKIPLKRFRMEADACPSADQLRSIVERRNECAARIKFLNAMQDKAEASPYTPEQIAALAQLHLSPKLYFSGPSTVHYTDRDAAAQNGEIDSYTRYKVGIQNLDMFADFRSGNEFLARRYQVSDVKGAVVAKPKLTSYLDGDTYKVKPPGKGKDTPADAIMARVGDAILLAPDRMTNAEITEALVEAERTKASLELQLQGVVMEVGCTGLLPTDLDAVSSRLEAEQFAAKYPDVKLSKDQKEGTFFLANNGLVVSVFPKTEWYTTAKGLAAAK